MRLTRRGTQSAGALLGILLLLAATASAGDEAAPAASLLEQIEAEHGIRVDRIQLAAAGAMLDLRYWVTDVDKAWALFRDTERRELIHPASGGRGIVPAPAYVGPLAQMDAQPKLGRQYFIFFANPGRVVQSGDEVIVHIGDLEIGPLKVR